MQVKQPKKKKKNAGHLIKKKMQVIHQKMQIHKECQLVVSFIYKLILTQ